MIQELKTLLNLKKKTVVRVGGGSYNLKKINLKKRAGNQ